MNRSRGEKLSGRLFPLRLKRASRAKPGRLKGRMQNIIVVNKPDAMFSQAVFFLRDDYFITSDLSPQELLKQAQEAAEEYVYDKAPPERHSHCLVVFIIPSLIFIILALCIIIT